MKADSRHPTLPPQLHRQAPVSNLPPRNPSLAATPAEVLLQSGGAGEPLDAQQRQQLLPLLNRLFGGIGTGQVAVPAPDAVLLAGLRRAGLLAGAAGASTRGTSAAEALPPLVLHDGQLWLGRFQRSMAACLARLEQMARAPSPLPAVDRDAVLRQLPGHDDLDVQQQQALHQWWHHRLLVLTGGPGTGKTTLVGQLLAADLARGGGEHVKLAAPTGKAAARLQEALQAAGHRLGAPGEALCRLGATTLHRLLELNRGGAARTAQRPVAAHTVVVDEFSMVDLPLLQMLLAALQPHARLLLVGDPAQLPPIGLGHPMAAVVKAGHGVVALRRTFRNSGAVAAVAQQLRRTASLHGLHRQLEKLQPEDNLSWHCGQPPQLPRTWRRRIQRHCQRLRDLASAGPVGDAERLAALDELVLLSATRQGGWGVETLNRQLLGLVRGESLPAGTPVICTSNAFSLDLANGDVGLVLNRQTALFRTASGPRRFPLQRLPGYEPALALTIHKSQGSQYGEVMLLWRPPDAADDPVALLYTGLTRARQRASLLSEAAAFDGDAPP